MEVIEFSPPMRPASGLFDLNLLGLRVGLIHSVKASEAVGLQHAGEALHEGPWMLTLADRDCRSKPPPADRIPDRGDHRESPPTCALS